MFSTIPSTLFLSPHVRCVDFGDGAIILDLRRDAYVGLDASAASTLRRTVRDWPETPPDTERFDAGLPPNANDLLEALHARGILVAVRSTVEDRRPTPVTDAMMMPLSPVHDTVSRVAGIGALLISIFLVLFNLWRRNGLLHVVEWVRRHQGNLPSIPSEPCDSFIPVLRSFNRLRPFLYTARRHCLFDSLVLSILLTRARLPCTFVIAVSRKPFVAHAWVQYRDLVLNDTSEFIQVFQPILAVGECSPHRCTTCAF